jgi:hypothetical protein
MNRDGVRLSLLVVGIRLHDLNLALLRRRGLITQSTNTNNHRYCSACNRTQSPSVSKHDAMDNTARGASDNGSESAILDDVGMPPDDDNQQQPNGSSLDHALLESIFYNEMALLDDFSEAFFASNGSYNSSTSSVSSGLGGASTPTTTTAAAANTLQGSGAAVTSRNEAAATEAAPTTAVSNAIVPDPTVAVEKDLLRDFGVAHSLSPALLSPVGLSLSPPPPTTTTLPFVPPPINVEEQRRNLQALAGRGRGIRHNVVAKAAAATTTSAAVPTTTTTMDLAANVAVAAVAAVGTTVADTGAVTGATGAVAPMDTADKRSKLVAQFATLAGRLGITLPPQVLHKLTAPNTTASSNSIGALETNEDILVDVTESSRKRPHEDMESSSSPRQLQAPAAAAAAAAKPYSKRRKKPRLSDCEQKLALLQAEQALLQSQVAQMANRNETLNQERLAAECKMRTMLHDPQSTPEQLDQAVQEFSDLYSDYGRKRHEELLFHLEQLQRYVYARSECAGMCAQFLFTWATHAQMTVVYADFPTPPTLPKWVCGPWAVADKTRLQHSRHPTRAILVTLAAQLSRVTRYPPATLLP